MIYKIFIEGRIGKTLFCGYLVRTDIKVRGFFIEFCRAQNPEPQSFTQGFKQALKGGSLMSEWRIRYNSRFLRRCGR